MKTLAEEILNLLEVDHESTNNSTFTDEYVYASVREDFLKKHECILTELVTNGILLIDEKTASMSTVDMSEWTAQIYSGLDVLLDIVHEPIDCTYSLIMYDNQWYLVELVRSHTGEQFTSTYLSMNCFPLTESLFKSFTKIRSMMIDPTKKLLCATDIDLGTVFCKQVCIGGIHNSFSTSIEAVCYNVDVVKDDLVSDALDLKTLWRSVSERAKEVEFETGSIIAVFKLNCEQIKTPKRIRSLRWREKLMSLCNRLKLGFN